MENRLVEPPRLVREIVEADYAAVYATLASEMVQTFNDRGALEAHLLLAYLGPQPGTVARIQDLGSNLVVEGQVLAGWGKDYLQDMICRYLRGEVRLATINKAGELETKAPVPDFVVHVNQGWVAGYPESASSPVTQGHEPSRNALVIVLYARLGRSLLGGSMQILPVTDEGRVIELAPYNPNNLQVRGRLEIAVAGQLPPSAKPRRH